MACKQVQNFRPPRSFDFQDFYQSTKTGKIFSKKCISGTKSKYNKSRFCFNIQHVKKIMQINLKHIHFNDFKHNGWHCRLSFFFTLALVERRKPSNSNYIRDVINYLNKGFPLLGKCHAIENSQGQIPRRWGLRGPKLRIGKKYPIYQPIRRQLSYIRWNYVCYTIW